MPQLARCCHWCELAAAIDHLRDSRLKPAEVSLGGAGLFGHAPDGVARSLHARLSRSTHGVPGHTNHDIWSSNGPVWIWAGFRDFWIDFCDTVAISYVFFKIGWPSATLPHEAHPLFGAASARWHGLGVSARREYFRV